MSYRHFHSKGRKKKKKESPIRGSFLNTTGQTPSCFKVWEKKFSVTQDSSFWVQSSALWL